MRFEFSYLAPRRGPPLRLARYLHSLRLLRHYTKENTHHGSRPSQRVLDERLAKLSKTEYRRWDEERGRETMLNMPPLLAVSGLVETSSIPATAFS
ncbi:uncharacterized protein LDX57_007892 [Aspergillus melleus]|uniref:uncharacterized protein n=1 Tax=Aspergillus melleus TaxID=138277 RepID=UPI001E8CCCE0|nr:uncharacterized protein LDX57_007892 [Aspergillus melleus]KAH8430223.1 hypothetical protein LDX57_007892 [Aspergillus melleus]